MNSGISGRAVIASPAAACVCRGQGVRLRRSSHPGVAFT